MLVGYMRISSERDRQREDLQKDALLKAGVDERHIFLDKISGSKDQRPGLKQLLEFIKPGDCLVVWKLDRLGRSLQHLLSILNSFKDKQIDFKSITEQIDTNTPMGNVMFAIFGALAQYEREIIIERTKAGLEAAKRRGKRLGPKFVVDSEKFNAMKRALEDGETKAAICRNFGVHKSTFNDYLRRDATV